MRVYLLTLIHIYTSLHLLQLTFILQINSDYWPDENKSLIVQLTKLMWHCKHIHFISKTYLCKPTYPYKCNGRLWNVVPNTEPWKRCKQIILYVLSITPKNFLNHLENLKIFSLYVTFITHKDLFKKVLKLTLSMIWLNLLEKILFWKGLGYKSHILWLRVSK